MQTSIIRPGFIVALRTTLRGGVSYRKVMLEPERMEGVAAVSKWETTRQIEDAEEHARAVVARGAARSAVSRVCYASATFGLFCLESRESELSDAIAEARQIANAHNAIARCTRVDVYVPIGRIAATDEEAARALADEVRELLAAMESAVRAANPEAIREAANKARALAGMLTEDTQRKVSAAIAEVRTIARDIVRRAAESGEVAASVVQGLQLEALTAARFAVLDLSGEAEGDTTLADTPGRAVDFEPEAPQSLAAESAPSLELF